MTNSIINHNSHAYFMLESRVLANTYTFSDPVSTNCLGLRFSLRFPQLIEPTTVEEQDLLGTMLARKILDFPSLCSDVQNAQKFSASSTKICVEQRSKCPPSLTEITQHNTWIKKHYIGTWVSHICLEASILWRRVLLRSPSENSISYKNKVKPHDLN